MNILSKAVETARKASSRLFSTVLSQWDRSGDLFKTRRQADLIKQYKGWVYACVNKNANGVASPAMEGALYKRTPEKKAASGKRIVKMGDHRARYVNENLSGSKREQGCNKVSQERDGDRGDPRSSVAGFNVRGEPP